MEDMNRPRVNEYMVDAELIESVMLRGNLLELILEHTELKPNEMYFEGACPFCKTAQTSFAVNKFAGMFSCQNCHKSGDLFKFVELFYDLDFLNAVAFLARKYELVPRPKA